ncbi:MAG TPA: hypothetical protein VNG31_06765 [Candidatus Baltobacteraceae bacterium]|nr:hypothetical protein [Candidatus Baltobacteraceae bacterium]
MSRRLALLAGSAALILVALFAARPVETPGPLLRDFEAYWGAGATLDAGRDPYSRAIWNAQKALPGVDAHRDEVLPFVSPPATLPFLRAIARLSYAAAAKLWWVILGLSLLGLVAVSLRGASSSLRGASASLEIGTLLAGVALAVSFGPATSDLALGQIAILALLAATTLCHPERAPSLAKGAVEGRLVSQAIASFVAFFQPNAAVGLIALLGRNATTLAILIGAIATYAVGTLAMGWTWPATYAAIVSLHASVERFSAIQITPAAIARGLGASPALAEIVAAACLTAAVIAGIALWRRIDDRFARFAALSALAPFAATFFHEHDLVVAFPAAVWCAVVTQGRSRALALAGTLLVAIDWLGLAQRPTGVAQSALLAGAAICAFAALGDDRSAGTTLRAAIPIALLFAAGAWLATHHPAPVWPDELGNFHAAASEPIAHVWRQEQERNGLLAVVPAWAALRALSLFGCALLAAAIYSRASCRRTASGYPDGTP